MPCYEKEWFVNKERVHSALLCGINAGVMDNPVRTPCDHLFCSDCIRQWLKVNQVGSKFKLKETPSCTRLLLLLVRFALETRSKSILFIASIQKARRKRVALVVADVMSAWWRV